MAIEVQERAGEARHSRAVQDMTLWHLKVSNYNEKARWALDFKGLAHTRRALPAGVHGKVAQRLSGGSTFPVLVIGDRAIGDSTEIIAELERRHPVPSLYPADPQLRRRALDYEEMFDEDLGAHMRRLVLHSALPHPRLMLAMFAPDLPWYRRLVARAAYGQIRKGVVRRFGLDAAAIDAAYAKVAEVGRLLADEARDGPYLVGDAFTVADLTLAALVSPAVAPEQFPYPQPQRTHPGFARLRRALDDSGIGAWTRGMYARHRGRTAEV